MIDQNGLQRSSGCLLFGPTEMEIEKCPKIFDAKEKIARLYLERGHRVCAHHASEPVKAFIQQRDVVTSDEEKLSVKGNRDVFCVTILTL